MGSYIDRDKKIWGKKALGWEAGVSGTYHYTEDLAFTLGYSHFFGSKSHNDRDCWFDDDDNNSKPKFDYVYAQTEISF
jgi:long-subunit fatty acid transport protein